MNQSNLPQRVLYNHGAKKLQIPVNGESQLSDVEVRRVGATEAAKTAGTLLVAATLMGGGVAFTADKINDMPQSPDSHSYDELHGTSDQSEPQLEQFAPAEQVTEVPSVLTQATQSNEFMVPISRT